MEAVIRFNGFNYYFWLRGMLIFHPSVYFWIPVSREDCHRIMALLGTSGNMVSEWHIWVWCVCSSSCYYVSTRKTHKLLLATGLWLDMMRTQVASEWPHSSLVWVCWQLGGTAEVLKTQARPREGDITAPQSWIHLLRGLTQNPHRPTPL